MFEITDTQKIGVGLAGFGISFLFLGVLLLFDKGLLAIGNILFISGLACVIGPKRTLSFFFQRHKIKASISFLGGIIVVLMGWPIVGMIIETYGFVLLFSGFLPVAINFLRRVPVLGTILSMPGLSKILDMIAEIRTEQQCDLSFYSIAQTMYIKTKILYCVPRFPVIPS
ncbi:LOW QUALITY PROTEIN: vesicle transport protein GOT1B [Calliopsis andreniformis]|uniref:LOW QUALITY PROTEIN: vesicle transport protein GOT1B n=1 Tax=Calliopsis andreniformis TaxID=337506 RepID=UPI003FCD508B